MVARRGAGPDDHGVNAGKTLAGIRRVGEEILLQSAQARPPQWVSPHVLISSFRYPRRETAGESLRAGEPVAAGFVGQLAGKAPQERNDLVHLRIREVCIKLDLGHDPDGRRQGVDCAVVKIRGRLCDVAQARNLEPVEVGWIVRHPEAALVDILAAGRLPVVGEHTELPEPESAQGRPFVALDTAGVDERS